MALSSRVPFGAILALYLTGCSGGTGTPTIVTGPSACSNLGQYVSIGGTAGFNTLVRRDFTIALLGPVYGLYEHASAIAAAIADSPTANPYAILNAIE